jgi:hypothetical protein
MFNGKIKMNEIFFLIKKHTAIFIKNVVHSDRLTCYPEEPRKGKFHIFFDSLRWLIRFHQSNANYYILGLDRKYYKKYKQKYINGRTCVKLRDRKNQQFSRHAEKYAAVIFDKFVAAHYMKSLGYPAPRTIALINNKTILLPGSEEEIPLDFSNARQQALIKDCICKPVHGGAGQGVHHLAVKDGQLFLNHERIEWHKINNLFADATNLIQERIIQHPMMAALNPHCVNTIRLVTVIDHETITPFSALVRVGRGQKITDNWHAGGIIIRLNMESGCLDKDGFTSSEYDGKRYTVHPETGVKFDGYAIPFCRQAIQLATGLHKYYYRAHSIGWDIAITDAGPVFIEANRTWGPDAHAVIEDDFLDKFMKYFK